MKERESNFEVLRVLAMLLIVTTHFLIWGTTHCAVGPIDVSFTNGWGMNAFLFPFISSFSSIGVILFILISSYFVSQSTTLRFDRLFKTWSVTWFYSVVIGGAAFLMHQCSGKRLLMDLAPLGTDQYWFVTKYIALMCLAPVYSTVVKNISKRGMLITLAILSLLVVNITHGVPYGNTFFSDSPNSVASFSLIFFIAAYIRKYGEGEFLAKHCGWIFILCILLQGAGGLIINYTHISSPAIYAGFSGGNNELSLVPATCLFIWFKNRKFKETFFVRALAQMAPYTFAVYLIHDNHHIRDFIWSGVVDPAEYWQSPWWIVLLVVMPVVIFLICISIDVIRTWLFKISGYDTTVEKIKEHNLVIE